MKRLRNRIILHFIISFFGFLLLCVVLAKNFASKGLPPQSWEEIYSDLLLYVIFSLIFAVSVTFKEYFNSPDDDSKIK